MDEDYFNQEGMVPVRKKKNGWFYLGLIVLAIIIVALYSQLKTCGYPDTVGNSWKDSISAYKGRSEASENRIQLLEQDNAVLKAANDSLMEQIGQSETKIVFIKQHANEERNNIAKLPPTEQFQLFASWLPTIDTSGR